VGYIQKEVSIINRSNKLLIIFRYSLQRIYVMKDKIEYLVDSIPIVDSIPRRLQAIIKVKGGNTKY